MTILAPCYPTDENPKEWICMLGKPVKGEMVYKPAYASEDEVIERAGVPLFFPFRPQPKPRMTKSDSWKGRPAVLRYFEYKDELLKHMETHWKRPIPNAMGFVFSFKVADRYVPNMTPEEFDTHETRPDTDNCIKAIWDSLLVDDKKMHTVMFAVKSWQKKDGLTLVFPAQ